MEETAATEESLTADRFAEAYEKGLRQTVRLLSNRCGLPPAEAEEFAQAAWARGWEFRVTLRKPAALAAWVNSIAMRLFLEQRRRGWREEELSHDPPIESRSPTAVIEAEEALRSCSPRDSRLLVNRYLFGYSTAELALQERIGNIAVRVRLSRARQQVREARSRSGEISHRQGPGLPATVSNFPLPSVA